jgi:hypothetical protein
MYKINGSNVKCQIVYRVRGLPCIRDKIYFVHHLSIYFFIPLNQVLQYIYSFSHIWLFIEICEYSKFGYQVWHLSNDSFWRN